MAENILDAAAAPAEKLSTVPQNHPLLVETQQELDAKRTFPTVATSRNDTWETTTWLDPRTGAEFIEITESGKLFRKGWNWPGGNRKVENSDGSGCSVKDNPQDGVLTIAHCWGPQAEDNFDVTNWRNGVERKVMADGTGTVTHKLDHDAISFHHWGPKEQDNFDGTDWGNGVVSFQASSGKGGVKTDRGDGVVTSHGWGPQMKDNFDWTKWQDGTVRIVNLDGTGSVTSHDGGGDKVHSWGPRPADNVDEVESPDGSKSVKRGDGSGQIDLRLPNGHWEHHSWGQK